MYIRTRYLVVLLITASFACAKEVPQDSEVIKSEKTDFSINVITDGLEHPWGMVFLPDGRMLITERPGQIRIIDKQGNLLPKPVKGMPEVKATGQGGLLDIMLDPDFRNNKVLYFSYSAPGDGGWGTEVARAEFVDDQLRNLKVIFRALPKSRSGHHFGSRLVIDRDGYLFITLGERNLKEPAQDMTNHLGSVIRIKPDGSVPEDNPFVKVKDAMPENYTYGHRNMQGAALNPWTREVWTHEHGPQGGDEINIVKAGTNYGWPVITYGVNYGTGTKIGEGTHKEGMAQPLYYWVPSIAPSGMVFYDGDEFPEWKGDLFVGSLKFQLLVRLEIKDNKVAHEERLLEGKLGRVRDVEVGPDGLLYVITDESNGVLAKLVPSK